MTEHQRSATLENLVFGPFAFDRTSRELRRDGQPVKLRKREQEILNLLIGRAGEFVSDATLMEAIWPGQAVAETNLRIQMAGLQRLLGEDAAKDAFIQFVQGSGYRFTPTVSTRDDAAAPRHDVRRHNLPTRRKLLVGRDTVLRRLQKDMSRNTVFTLVAQGGIGKTALAIAAGEQAIGSHADGVWLIDLAGITTAERIAEAMTATFALPSVGTSRRKELMAWLTGKDLLLILDNCEQVAEAVADLVAEIRRHCDTVSVLATSRKVLGIDGEVVVPLEPLAVPPPLPMTADIALTFPAVAFFVDCLRDNGRTFELDGESLRLIIQLCQGLKGNPLAIELAAARMCLLGAGSIAAHPEAMSTIVDEIAAIWKRQDIVLATLDWSYQSLSANARLLLARLSVCRREFTTSTALAIAVDDDLSRDDVLVGLGELTGKSLISVGEFAEPVIYHMLVLVRDFAAEKLQACDDRNEVARRHALNCFQQLRDSGPDAPDQSHAASIDDIRAAVDWSFSDGGDALTGMRLISMAVDNKKKLYGMQDYARQLDRALARYDELRIIEPRLQLRIIVERMCINQHGNNDVQLMARLKTRAFELAQGIYTETGDPADLFAIHQTAFSLSFSDGNGPEKKLYARQMHELAERSQIADAIEITSPRLTAQAHHFMGEHALAVPLMKKILSMSDAYIRQRTYIPGDRVDPRLTMGILNARSSWLLGKPEQATAEAAALVEAVRANWDYVLCYVIAFSALPIALWRGDIAGARIHMRDLKTRAEEFQLDYWANWAQVFEQAVDFFESGRIALTDPLQPITQNNMQIDLLATFHESLLSDEALERVEAGFVGWCAPEVLRADAEKSLNAGTMTATDAEEQLRRALALAERQDALSWQLRVATSLGRLWRYQGKSAQAAALLNTTTAKFTEGFGDADFVSAMALLKDL